MTTALRWILQLHKDVPKAAKLYSEGLGFNISVCTLRWAELELHPGPLKLALMQAPTTTTTTTRTPNSRDDSNMMTPQKEEYSSLLSFTVTDINATVTKLMGLGAELDGRIKYETHGKVAALRCLDGHTIGLYEPF